MDEAKHGDRRPVGRQAGRREHLQISAASIGLTGESSWSGSNGTSMKLRWVAPWTWMV
jgi:hypothetical protein